MSSVVKEFERNARTGDVKDALILSATTGIVIAQANSWDRFMGSMFSYIFSGVDSDSPLLLLGRAISTTFLGLGIVLVLQRCS
jgi:hypothetical protein